jgi:hypothetical protein
MPRNSRPESNSETVSELSRTPDIGRARPSWSASPSSPQSHGGSIVIVARFSDLRCFAVVWRISEYQRHGTVSNFVCMFAEVSDDDLIV